jgi:RNA polymerase sigma-70 factor (ECF subfamily)
MAVLGGVLLEALMSPLEPDSATTLRLLEQVQAGDREAFNRLFERHRSALTEFIDLRLDPGVRTRVDPSDVVQETQMEAFRRLGDFLERRPMPFRMWLRKTAFDRITKARRFHRAGRRTVGREAALPDRSSLILARQFLARDLSPSQQLADRELVQRIRQVLDRLTESDRQILLMRNVENLPYEEAACLLNVDAVTARKRYGRALLRLRKLLRDDGLLESSS